MRRPASLDLLESRDLLSWLGTPPRSPKQTHGIHESDSEILDLGNGTYLASTVDSISEEISVGLYRDPYTMGWLTANASLSDLAAVGATPLGILLSTEWDRSYSQEMKARFSKGLSDALEASGTYLLGGDTGSCRTSVFSGVGLGLCSSKPLSRIGIKKGDWICVTGKTGKGPALAIRFLLGLPETDFPESFYRPEARLKVGQALQSLASACMDTSDGLLSTLDTLRTLNGVELDLTWNPDALSPDATDFLQRLDLPLWLLWAVEHRDYELVLGIPEENLAQARNLAPELIPLGRATDSEKSFFRRSDESALEIDWQLLRNLTGSYQGNLKEALIRLIDFARTLRLP